MSNYLTKFYWSPRRKGENEDLKTAFFLIEPNNFQNKTVFEEKTIEYSFGL